MANLRATWTDSCHLVCGGHHALPNHGHENLKCKQIFLMTSHRYSNSVLHVTNAMVTPSCKSPTHKSHIRPFFPLQNWVGRDYLMTVTVSTWLLRGLCPTLFCENCFVWLLQDIFMWRCDRDISCLRTQACHRAELFTIKTVFTREQKCAILIIIRISIQWGWRYFGPCVRKFTSQCVFWIAQYEWSFRMTVFWTVCTQNYIAMCDLNCAIQMTVQTIIRIAHFKLRIAMWFGVHMVQNTVVQMIIKLRNSNDNSNCALLLSCENSQCLSKDCYVDNLHSQPHPLEGYDISSTSPFCII